MSFVSASTRLFPGAPKRKLCLFEEKSLEELRTIVSLMPRARKGFAPLLKKHLRGALGESGWELSFVFGDFPELGRKQSPVTIDAMKDSRVNDCPHRHRVLMEICTDNRQAIPLNLLKLEFASRRFQQGSDSNVALPVMVVVSGEAPGLVTQGAVDSAVGTLKDYIVNANGPWAGLLQSSLYVISVN